MIQIRYSLLEEVKVEFIVPSRGFNEDSQKSA